jgi:glycosyltransferase involved in cell wall biosynthesis
VVHSFLFSENWRTRIAALAAPGARVISSERSVNTWKRWRHHALERLLIRVTDRVVANAEAIRRFLVEEGGLPASKIVVIPNGVDTTRFAPRGDRNRARAERGWGPETLVIGHTGTMVPHKGQSEVLRAVALAAKRLPSIRVVLLGDGPDRGALEALARALGLEGRIEMPGFVGDVESLLPCLDVYVHFSREREGCSNAILEAMACGLPVIATDVGGNRELVEEGRTGCLVGEEDIEAVASALVRLGLDATLRKEFGRAAARVVGERFSVPKMVGATAALYEAVCAEGTPGGGR